MAKPALHNVTYSGNDKTVLFDANIASMAIKNGVAILVPVNVSGATNKEVLSCIAKVRASITTMVGVVFHVVLYEDIVASMPLREIGIQRSNLVEQIHEPNVCTCVYIPVSCDVEAYARRQNLNVSLVVHIPDPVSLAKCAKAFTLPKAYFEGTKPRDIKINAYCRVNGRTTMGNGRTPKVKTIEGITLLRDLMWLTLLIHNILVCVMTFFGRIFTCGKYFKGYTIMPKPDTCLIRITTPKVSSREEDEVYTITKHVERVPLNDCAYGHFLYNSGHGRWFLWRVWVTVCAAVYTAVIWFTLVHEINDFWVVFALVFIPKAIILRFFVVRRYYEPCWSAWNLFRTEESEDSQERFTIFDKAFQLILCLFYAVAVTATAPLLLLRCIFARVRDSKETMLVYTHADFNERLKKETAIQEKNNELEDRVAKLKDSFKRSQEELEREYNQKLLDLLEPAEKALGGPEAGLVEVHNQSESLAGTTVDQREINPDSDSLQLTQEGLQGFEVLEDNGEN